MGRATWSTLLFSEKPSWLWSGRKEQRCGECSEGDQRDSPGWTQLPQGGAVVTWRKSSQSIERRSTSCSTIRCAETSGRQVNLPWLVEGREWKGTNFLIYHQKSLSFNMQTTQIPPLPLFCQVQIGHKQRAAKYHIKRSGRLSSKLNR